MIKYNIQYLDSNQMISFYLIESTHTQIDFAFQQKMKFKKKENTIRKCYAYDQLYVVTI